MAIEIYLSGAAQLSCYHRLGGESGLRALEGRQIRLMIVRYLHAAYRGFENRSDLSQRARRRPFH